MTTKPVHTARCPLGIALAALALFSPWVHAAAIVGDPGDPTLVPFYRSLSFGGVDRNALADPGIQFADLFIVDRNSNVAPLPVANIAGTVNANGATFTTIGQSASSGLFAARNYAQLSVSNAHAGDSYLTTAGHGSASSVRFNTSQASAGMARYTWQVTGSASNTSAFGRADARLDFGATTQSGLSWNSLFDGPGNAVGGVTYFGPGTFTYELPLADLGATINLYYWSSAFAQLLAGSAPGGTSVTMTANFANTFVLADVDLFDTNGAELTDWEMLDLTSNTVAFDQTGRLAPISDAPDLPTLPNGVPEPGVPALVLAALLGLVAMRRRVQSAGVPASTPA